MLLSPSGAPNAYYAEHGWVAEAGKDIVVPAADTVWTAETPGPLTASSPVTLTYDNGKGLKFTRIISRRRQIHVHGRRQGRQYRLARR